MSVRRWGALLTAVVAGPASVLAIGSGVGPAAAAPVPDHEMPFPCGAVWTGTTRSSHSPSSQAIDFNRRDDIGDLLVSSARGRVTRVADLGSRSYGKYVIVDHGGAATSLYAHLQSVWITQGQQVDQGTILGQVGASGRVTGAHLHFEERLDGRVQRPYFHGSTYRFGTTSASQNCPDVPVAGAWDGSAADRVGVFRRGQRSGTFLLQTDGGTQAVRFGRGHDTPVTGDWDGDGRTDVGVRRTGKRLFLLREANGTSISIGLGKVRDVPVTGDWNGDGTTEVGVWRPGSARFRLRAPNGVVTVVPLGSVGAVPVTGDWNSDRRTDLGVFDPATATFTLRTRSGTAAPVLTTVRLGTAADLPVTGDWDGNGTTDVGVWSPSTATFTLRATPTGGRSTAVVTTQRFGRAR